MPKFWSLFALPTLCSILASALPTPTSSASSAASSVPAASDGFPTGAKVGIGIGVTAFALLLAAFSYLLRRLTMGQRVFSRNPPSVQSKIIEFISLYGEDGVVLRELLMLASISYLQGTQSSKTKKAFSKEVVSLEKVSKSLNFMHAFMLYAIRPERLAALQDDLVCQDRIIVRQQSGQATPNQDTWAIDGRVWIAGANRAKLGDTARREFYTELIDVFRNTPDECILCIQGRRMEAFYNHARLVGIYICQRAQKTSTHGIRKLGISQDSREQFLHMMMRLLTYRYRAFDEEMMDDLQALLEKSDIHPALHPRLYVMWDWAQVKRELESSISTPSLAVGIIANLRLSPQWSQGLVGLLLADSIRKLERLPDSDALGQVLNWSYEWCDVVNQSRDHEVMSALCILLPQIKLWDRLARMPERYHMDCGYHLSRLGYPELAERFLVSGLTACGSDNLGKTWRYRVELLAVTMRLGQWQEAEVDLQVLRNLEAEKFHNATFDGDFDAWQLSGDFCEFKLSINCLLADCFIARGEFQLVERQLRAPLHGIQGMQDHYIRSMRVTAQSRVLHAQLQLGSFHSAVVTSLQQCRDVFEYDGSLLEEGTVRWVADELLICTNELVHAGLLSGAMEILNILVAANGRIKTLLHTEVCEYIQRRHANVLRLIANRRPSMPSELAPNDAIRTAPRQPSSAGSTERHQAIAAAKGLAKQQHKPEKRLSPARLRKQTLLRLSRL